MKTRALVMTTLFVLSFLVAAQVVQADEPMFCSDASAAAMVMSNAAQAKETQTESKLVFNRYGNRYFLSQVWAAGSIRGRQLLKSSREKEISQLARIETKSEVTLVARLSPARP